ncbi:ThuA domain-containing protein [Cellulosimicrobium sp. PMB13]|uniref:ThuA domain-containing protein n=1 Tax=Cellulosimicrobium sp. PMB13 TaxID=3120158 RepID=UPI003F4B4859
MSPVRRLFSLTTALSLVAVGALLAPPASAAEDPPPPPPPAAAEEEAGRLLVFSKTAAFRHGSIPQGIAAVQAIGDEHGITVDTTEDAAAFTPENLATYDAVVFMSTTGDVLDDGQQAAFEEYIRGGGGYVGVHAASDTEYTWPWYGELVGAYFSGHPAVQPAGIHVEDRTHPSTSHLPQRWERTDEWYNFGDNPRGDVHVLMTLDETSYQGGGMGADHPVAWCQYHEGGRSWYTGLGHTPESFVEPAFVEHLTGGVLWATGAASDDCGGTVDANYQKVVLDDEVASPMGLQVADDGRVLYIERAGQLRVIDPETGTTSTAGRLQVHSAQENGLLGIELDPDFAENGWVYLFYTPHSDLIDSPHQRLSRFTLEGDTLDLASEQILLQIPHQRDECCHSGGYLDFDAEGDLWISVGDDSSPGGAPGGYAPIDERPGSEVYDAQRSSGNTNDLRGKLLQITPTDDGSYTVPEGNLVDTEWAAGQDTSKIRPEIFAMGLRNPFRFAVDQTTGAVYLGDYGPDASVADPRGIDGRVEWNVITEPGNYGWPYCHGGGAYVDFDYATNQPGELFDCSGPVNDSPNNTGLTVLPPVIEPLTSYGRSLRDPDVGTGGAPMGGPAYTFDAALESDRKWPRSMADKPFFYEWGQNRLYQLHLDEDGAKTDITRVLDSMQLTRPHAMVFGEHDGAMYLIEWGSGFGGNNPDAQVVRIDYTGGNDRPLAKVAATPRSGGVPLVVEFSSAGTAHPQGGDLTYAWDFGDGGTSTDPNPTHTYTAEGNYTAVLTVSDVQGRTGTANATISVGNTEPEVEVLWPANGTVFTYGDTVEWEVAVTDAEEGSTAAGDIDCADVTVELILGHDDHGHPMKEATGCSGSFVLEPDSGHTDTDRITYAIEARYTDGGSPAGVVAPLTGRDVVAMQPSRKQAEHYTLGTEVRAEATADPMGGDLNVGFIRDNSAMTYEDFNFANVDALRFRVASPNDTSRIEIRKDSADGELLGSVAVPRTGGFQAWDWAEAAVDDPGGTFDLVLLFRGADGYLLNLNWFDVVGDGAAGGPPITVPTPVAELSPAEPQESGWYHDAVSLSLTAEEGDAIEYQVGATGAWTPYTAPVPFAEDGRYEVAFRAVRGESTSNRDSVVVQVDGTTPSTTADLTALTEGDTFTGDVSVTLEAADATSGAAGTTVRVDGGDEVAYDGAFTVTGDGEHVVEFRTTDAAGNVEPWQSVRFASPSGQRPEITLSDPPLGGVVPFGKAVRYEAAVADPSADCADVRARLVVTRGDQVWRGEPTDGCTGLVTMERPTDAGPADRLRYEVEVLYARGGHDGEVRNLAQARASVRLQPALIQAEHADSTVRTEPTGDSIGGGLNVGWLRDNATISYADVNLAGIEKVRFRMASSSIGGTLELHAGSASGALIGSVPITNTGGGQSYQWFDVPVTDPGGPITLVLVFRATGTHYIANVNLFELVGDGVSTEPAPEGLAISTVVEPRCLAGKVYVAVRATNDDTAPADITLTTPFGTRTVADVAPGKSAYQAFATRSASVPAGTAQVSAERDGRTFGADVEHAALSCG